MGGPNQAEGRGGPESPGAEDQRRDDQATPWTSRLAFDEGLLRRILQSARPPRQEAVRDRRRRRDMAGKRLKTRTNMVRGRYVRSVAADEFRDIALDATIRAAAVRQSLRGRVGPPLRIGTDDVHAKVRERRMGHLLVFLVDASSSMGTETRVVATQGAILALLVDAYQRRDRVGLITFRERFAEVILRPTGSVEKARRAFERIAIGGTTPLSAGLAAALELIHTELAKDPTLIPLLVLITDAMPNVSMGGMDPTDEALAFCELVRAQRIPALVLDTEGGFTKSLLVYAPPGRGRDLARAMGARYVPLADITHTAILDALRAHEPAAP